MNFSELFRQSHHLCKFSPDGKYLASATDYRLVIRDVETLQIQHLYSCLDGIQCIEWSADSDFILCGMFKRGIVQVWSIEQPEWNCKIDEGSAGLSAVRWSPDGRHILTTADFNLRITVWSLVTKSVSYIRYPKQCEKGIDFSSGGKYMALAERRDCKDYVSIFACSTWELVKHFDTDTEDLAGLKWSPDGRVLGVWESPVNYKMLIYSLDGRCLATYTAYDFALGIKNIAWSLSSQFLAIGSFDEKVRILNHITWKKVAEFSHPSTVENNNVVVYKEVETRAPIPSAELPAPTTTLFTAQSKYDVEATPAKLPVVKPASNKANPKLGVGTVAFSHDCKYMYTKNDNMPNALWIWDVQKLTLSAVLVQAAPIKCVQWDSSQTRLALCTSTNKLYMWSASGCLSVEIPAEASFQVSSLQWHKEGKALLLMGKEQMCVCFVTNANNTHNDE
ncbi:WD repeat-containing protein WRAP73-like [Haliotis rufescens]|uniref:WD repeat-containing protein WRAP73-like n=1 Tax=Haliotis rufescens TaxID=6454 RepID=UPI00201E97F8|nr:WD repeat-containing protein WRAP73-like [Haliotis rufescens]